MKIKVNGGGEAWAITVRTREQFIEELKDRVGKGYYIKAGEAQDVCDKHGIELYEDVLSPMGWNSCDRCEILNDSEVGLYWLDYDDEPDEDFLKGLEKEGEDYCALCYYCVQAIKEKGGKQ